MDFLGIGVGLNLKAFSLFCLGFWAVFASYLHAQVQVEDLSIATSLPKTIISPDDFSPSHLKGQYFRYHRLNDGKRGLLYPIKDQSCSAQSCRDFYPIIQRGTVGTNVASSLFDRADQMQRLEIFGGPKVHALALISEGDPSDPYQELGLIVDHVEGERLPHFPANRSPAISENFLQSFHRMTEFGFIPLDFQPDNFVTYDDRVRPVDVALMTEEELRGLETQNPWAHRFRLMQMAITVGSIESSTAGQTHTTARQCADYVRKLNERFQMKPETLSETRKRFGSPALVLH